MTSSLVADKQYRITPPDRSVVNRSVVSVNSSVCPGSHGVFERDAIEQVQDLRARVVAQDLVNLVRQILNRDGGHIPLAAAPNT
jgi:hypothetical protein